MHTPATHQRFKEPTAPKPRASCTEGDSLPSAAVRAPLRPRFSHRGGFTLLEIIAVLVLVGILSAVAVSRFTDADAEDVAAANTLKLHLRYAQLRAMGDTVPWGISFTGNSYELQKNGSTAPVNLPGENGTTITLSGLTMSPTTTVTFSAARGQPTPNGHSISIGTQTITITQETGFIP